MQRQSLQVTIIFAIIATMQASGYRNQEIVFFANPDFTNKLESFDTTELDLEEGYGQVASQAKSHCVIRGLWRIAGTFNRSPNIFVELAHATDKDGRICGSWNTGNQTANYKSIQLIGHRDLDKPGLTLNTKSRFDGRDLFFDGNMLRLPNSVIYNSYGFTGKDNWTLYSNPDFTGDAECLIADATSHKPPSVTYNTNRTIIVGSIWRGCRYISSRIIGTDPPPKSLSGKTIMDLNILNFFVYCALILNSLSIHLE